MSPQRNEIPRITLPPLPDPAEKDTKKIIQAFSDSILELYKRDSEKERRIQELEANQ